MTNREFYVVIEKDEDGYLVGEVPQLQGCYSQGKTLDELMTNIKEVIQLCLEDETNQPGSEFVGIQKIEI
jgi:predicted RNase H-like HicB family nuclease